MFIYGDRIGKVELVQHMGSDLTVVNAARVSFGKHKDTLDDKDKKLIKYLIKNQHLSTLEHCEITFKFTVPLFVRSQHHRHRTWKYNEKSYRYSGENIQFYIPQELRAQAKDNKQASIEFEEFDHVSHLKSIQDHCEYSYILYTKLVNAGVARELARIVLPVNLYTEYYGTVSLRNALAFIELRLHPHAQWEIQQVAKAMLEILEGLYPETIKIWKELNSSS